MDFWFRWVKRLLPPGLGLSRLAGALILCGTLLVVFSVTSAIPSASAQPPAANVGAPAQQDVSAGKALFESKCIGCHTVGGGKRVGPDLKGVTQRRSLPWIESFLRDPGAMLDSDDIAKQLLQENNNVRMPNLGLTSDQIDSLVAFLSNPGSQPVTSAPAPAGNAAAGRMLFTGEKALAHGGPHCMACHTVAGTGNLGGGGLGPDLTHVVQRLSETGLAGALNTIAFPTMIGPFQNHPLTVKEQADLVAFLKEADRKQGPVANSTSGALSANAMLVFGIGLAAAGLLFVLLAVLWLQIKKRYGPRLPVRKL